jgi:hypothetical protein
MGLSVIGFFVVRKFSGTSWDNVCLGGEGDVGDSILTPDWVGVDTLLRKHRNRGLGT